MITRWIKKATSTRRTLHRSKFRRPMPDDKNLNKFFAVFSEFLVFYLSNIRIRIVARIIMIVAVRTTAKYSFTMFRKRVKVSTSASCSFLTNGVRSNHCYEIALNKRSNFRFFISKSEIVYTFMIWYWLRKVNSPVYPSSIWCINGHNCPAPNQFCSAQCQKNGGASEQVFRYW